MSVEVSFRVAAGHGSRFTEETAHALIGRTFDFSIEKAAAGHGKITAAVLEREGIGLEITAELPESARPLLRSSLFRRGALSHRRGGPF